MISLFCSPLILPFHSFSLHIYNSVNDIGVLNPKSSTIFMFFFFRDSFHLLKIISLTLNKCSVYIGIRDCFFMLVYM
jgi:hypothetical protein